MSFFKRRTIASITAPITNIVTQLDAHAELHAAKADGQDVAAARHTRLAQEATEESSAASVQATKIASVFDL